MSLVSVSEERSGKWWTRNGVIKCSECGGEIVGASLRSHRLLCRTPPHKCGFLLMTVLLQDLTQSNSSLPLTKDTVTVCQATVVVFFYKLIFLIILWLYSGPPSIGEIFFLARSQTYLPTPGLQYLQFLTIPWWWGCRCMVGHHGQPGKPSSEQVWWASGTKPGTLQHTLRQCSAHPDNWKNKRKLGNGSYFWLDWA